MKRSLPERITVLAALLLVLAVNWLANGLPLGGVRTGEVSAMYESYFTPAGFTFAIWSVIYAGLLLYVFYQMRVNRFDEQQLQPIGRLFILNSLLNCAWLFAWHYQLLVVAWAAYGIASKQLDVPEIHGAALSVSMLALFLALFTLPWQVFSRGTPRS